MATTQEQDQTDVEIPGPGGKPVPMRTLFYDKSPDREIHLVSSPDRMSAYLKIDPGPHYSGFSRETVDAILVGAGVVHGAVSPGITLFVGTQNSPRPFHGYFQVAAGDAMSRGENGSVEFHVQPTSLQPRYEEGDAGNIDFKQPNLIENCFAGQRIATVLPPGPGRPGRDVFGGELAPEPGNPTQIQPGPGVVVSPNGRDFTAEIEGRVVFRDGVLSVSPVLEINRDVDYSVGNVDFVGKVVVRGSLLDGFYINARHGVEITGEVGASRITTGGDVTVGGGIRGRAAAIITCRDLAARYIDEATVEASGNVTATKEILNSSVKSLGRVSVTNGAIVGGVVCGLKGVETDGLGSDLGVATWAVAGLDWTEENQKEEIRARVAEYMDRAHSAKTLLDPLFADKALTSRLGADHKSMLAELSSELRDLRDNLREQLEARQAIACGDHEGMLSQVNVRKTLYQGVSVRLSEVDGEIKDSVKGPVSITQDTGRSVLHIGAMTDLPPLGKELPDDGGAEAGAKPDNGAAAGDGT